MGGLELTRFSRLRFWWFTVLDFELENLDEVFRVDMTLVLAYFLFLFRELCQLVMQ